jgi:protein O-mannosyl-transferase
MTLPSRPEPARARLLAAGVAALVFVLATLPFLGALEGDFLDWDDRMTLVENTRYRGFDSAAVGWMATTFHMGHFMPLTWLSYAVDFALWGLEPRGFHLTNLLLHGLNAVLVVLLAEKLMRAAALELNPSIRRAGAVLAALLFALHPLRVESVAWITERRDVLSCSFLLLTVLAYLRYVEADARRALWMSLTLVLYVLSLLSKAWGITLPAALLLLDLLVLRRRAEPAPVAWKRLIGEKLLFVPWAFAGAWLAAAAQGHGQAMLALEEHGALERVAQACYGLVAYPLLTLWPARLSPLYALELDVDGTRPIYLACMAVVLAVSAMLIVLRRRFPVTLAAWASYAILVSPVLGLLQSGVQKAADRYTYIACIPLVLWASAGLAGWVQRVPRRRFATGAAALASLIALGTLARAQTRVWRDSVSVWSRVVEVEPDNYIGHWMLGVALHEQQRYEPAVEHFQTALALRDDADARAARNNPGLRFRMALSLLALGRGQEAEAALTKVLEARPNHPPAIQLLSGLYEQQGRVEEADRLFIRAVKEDPESRSAWFELCGRLLAQERYEDALLVGRQALQKHPDDARLHARVGFSLLCLQRFEPAERELRRALELDPRLAAAQVNLGVALEKQGRLDEARQAWLAALEIDPDNPDAREHLRSLPE